MLRAILIFVERRLGRTIAIIIVIAVIGAILLADRAQRLARQRQAFKVGAATDAAAADSATTADPDSVRIVGRAMAAYDDDRRARGEEPLATRVFAYVVDSAGVLVTLFARGPILGQDAVVRVSPDGGAQVVTRGR